MRYTELIDANLDRCKWYRKHLRRHRNTPSTKRLERWMNRWSGINR